MRKVLSITLLVALLVALPLQASAAITGDPIQNFGLPMLITNAGQGPGGKMCRLLTTQTQTLILDTDFFYLSEPQPEDLKNDPAYSSLFVVIGSSDKGLGASGITIDDELARLEEMVAHAKEIELPIVAVLLEKDKRSDIPTNANERCIDAICPNAEWMIVVADGNTDGRFDAISEEYGIPLTIIDTTLDFTELAKQAFIKSE